MDTNIENISKEQISKFLPDALAKAITSYQKFMEREIKVKDDAEYARNFAAHHTACKVAIAHIELLLKFARWLDLPDPKMADHNNQIILAAMIQEAENELENYKTGELDA